MRCASSQVAKVIHCLRLVITAQCTPPEGQCPAQHCSQRGAATPFKGSRTFQAVLISPCGRAQNKIVDPTLSSSVCGSCDDDTRATAITSNHRAVGPPYYSSAGNKHRLLIY